MRDVPATVSLAAHMSRNVDDIVEELLRTVRLEMRELDPLAHDALAECIRVDVTSAIRAAMEDRMPNEAELARAAQTAATFARAGVSRDALLRARRIGIRRACELFREHAAELDFSVDDQVQCIFGLWAWADAIQVSNADAHRAVADEVGGRDEAARSWFVRALLEGSLSRAETAARAVAYGLLPGAKYYPLRGRPRPGVEAAALAHALEATGADGSAGALVATFDGEVWGVVSRLPDIGSRGVVGVGVVTDLFGIGHSFVLAGRTLDTALAFDHDGVVTLDDVSLRPAVISETQLGRRLVDRYLRPLDTLGDFGATLEDSMRAYLEHDLHVERTAEALFVHPNTLRHRLERFQQITGANLRSVEQLLELWWALETRRLRLASRGASGE